LEAQRYDGCLPFNLPPFLRIHTDKVIFTVTKIKKDLITKAKVKKQYAKIKAAVEAEEKPLSSKIILAGGAVDENDGGVIAKKDDAAAAAADKPQQQEDGQTNPAAGGEAQGEEPEPPMHPERLAMIEDPTPAAITNPVDPENPNLLTVGESEGYKPKPNRQRRERRHRPDYYEKQLAEAERKKKEAEARAAEFARREEEKQNRIQARERYRKQMAKARQPGRDGKRKLGRESNLLLDKAKRIMGGA